MTKKILVTGSAGLIGSEAVAFYGDLGHQVLGIDNNMRQSFFGPDGDTTWNRKRLEGKYQNYAHLNVDIRDREGIARIFKEQKPDIIVHCAAQPSHDLAKDRPFDDFDTNAVGTVNLLEATRQYCAESPFLLMSTNKVYGDAPNEIPLVEKETRWEYANEEDWNGVSESCRIDHCTHSLFGASKVAADIMAQEYGRYFNMPVGVFRGGCLTGSHHSGAELHGFLAYLVRCVIEGRTYKIIGYKGKQVRDNIHSYDVMTALDAFANDPKPGEAYNLGGCRENSVSVIEAIAKVEAIADKKLETVPVEAARVGDHICYISDMAKFKKHFPNWKISWSLDQILEACVSATRERS